MLLPGPCPNVRERTLRWRDGLETASEFRELLVVLVLVRGGMADDEGDGERWRPKRPCFFSGTGAGSSMTSSSGFRLEKNGIVDVGLFISKQK